MQRTALQPGDLVQVGERVVLWRMPNWNRHNVDFSDIVVDACGLGLLLGTSATAAGLDVQALVLDSKTGTYGWCSLGHLRRVQ
jgi:hypothetical protein